MRGILPCVDFSDLGGVWKYRIALITMLVGVYDF